MLPILTEKQVSVQQILTRRTSSADVSDTVSQIMTQVRTRGDAALLEYASRFDGASLTALEVTEEEIQAAFDAVSPEFLRILTEAADNIRSFHEKQIRTGFILSQSPGIVMGQRILPIEKVGLYVPGGTAAYPSTVLMDAIPAKLAGCSQIVITTPPGKDGAVAPAILAAAKIAGVTQIFKAGGAQAIAALAYGTESIPKVHKIVGPGNAFVAEAKRQVFGLVSIDMVAGPSDILVIADDSCSPAVVAADMLSQAEHDTMASAVLITDSPALAQAVQKELTVQLSELPRQEIARVSLENNGKIIVAESIASAVSISNALAPEHLELCVRDPFDYLDSVTNAGSVFLGKNCPEVLGDYMAGPNHTLPTGGTARFSSPLSVDDFVKKTQYTYYSAQAFRSIAEKIALFAHQEGLHGHARSATVRLEDKQQ